MATQTRQPALRSTALTRTGTTVTTTRGPLPATATKLGYVEATAQVIVR